MEKFGVYFQKNIFLSILSLVCSLPSIYAIDSNDKHIDKIGEKKNLYYSQFGQDRFVNEKWFKNKKNGVFVEIGAHNGITFSNTKFFEELGWTGICIEPNPKVFEDLKKNRSCICIQGCISDRNGKDSFLWIEGNAEMLSGLLSKYDPAHLNRVKYETAKDKAPICIDVECYLLNDVLRENGIFQIDFLSIDTEGGELDILKSIDYDQFDIEIITVENNFKDKNFKNFLIKKGYELVGECRCDNVFKKIR